MMSESCAKCRSLGNRMSCQSLFGAYLTLHDPWNSVWACTFVTDRRDHASLFYAFLLFSSRSHIGYDMTQLPQNSYQAVLARPQVPLTFSAALVGRLAYPLVFIPFCSRLKRAPDLSLLPVLPSLLTAPLPDSWHYFGQSNRSIWPTPDTASSNILLRGVPGGHQCNHRLVKR